MKKSRSTCFDWNHARAFLVAAEAGSLSAGSAVLGLTQPTLSRQVSALEDEIGVALFIRGTTGLELTPGGLDLLHHIQDMGDAASRFALAAMGQSASIAGSVCITATELMSVHILPDILVDLQRQQPEIQIELISSNTVSDLGKREADIAIRGYRPTQSNLIAKKIGVERYKLFASKEYIDRFGLLSDRAEIDAHRFVGIDQSRSALDIFQSSGLDIDQDQFHVMSENSLSYWSLVKAGAGIGVMHEGIGLADPLVQLVMPDVDFPTMEIWLVAHRELKTSKRIRFVYDYLSTAFKKYYLAV